MIDSLEIRPANPTDADEILAARRDAILSLSEEYGRAAAERWANAAPPDRAAKAIASNSVWVAELGAKIVGWVEINGATIESLYVRSAAARRGIGSLLLTHAERQIRATGASVAYLDASPNAEAFYARRGYVRAGDIKQNNSRPMRKEVPRAQNDLPQPIATLVDELATLRGAVAVVLGGSRALGSADSGSDWDLGLYYRGAIDLSALSARGDIHPPGSWGRIMNGGAWLRCEEHRVDVLLRDLDVVEHWLRRAEEGEFEVDALLGYVAGAPTYMLAAELASCRVLHGTIPASPYPQKLTLAGPPRWRICRSFSIAYARVHAKRGNVVGALGQAAKAVLEEAHAILCERGEWVCNEKRMVEAADLSGTQALFGRAPAEPAALVEWVDVIARELGVALHDLPPWAATD